MRNDWAMSAGSIATEASGTNDPMAAVRRFADAFNRGDVKAMASAFAIPASILDGLPPHVWYGPTACEDWYRDVTAASEREDAKGYFVTFGEPWHVNVTGDPGLCSCSRNHDVQSSRQAGYAIRLGLYGGVAQTRRGVANNGVGERHSITTGTTATAIGNR